jgi:putative heme-binding domain-containing protein
MSPLLVELASTAANTQLSRIHAVWAMGELSGSNPALLDSLAALCGDSDAEIRAQAAKTLSRGAGADAERRHACGAALVPLLAEESPRVRAFAAISIGKLAHREALAGLLELARENHDRDPVERHAAAVGLAGSQTSEALAAAISGAGESERLAIVLALGRQKSPLVAELLRDEHPRVHTEAARCIWDAPITAAYAPLAAALNSVPSSNEPMLRRALAASAALGSQQHLEAVIVCGLRPDLSPGMREHAWRLVREWATPSSRDPVHGLWRPLPARSSEELNTALRRSMPKLIAAGVPGGLALVVAAELGIADAHAPLIAVLADDAHSPEVHARALAALGAAETSIAAQAIDAGLKSEAPAVRSGARKLLMQHFPEQAVEQLQDVLETATIRERQAALGMLAGLDLPAAHAIIKHWMDRLEDGACPPELQLEVIEAVLGSTDPALAQRYQQYSQRIGGDGSLTQHSASLLGGDPEVGRRIFDENSALACRRCHSTTPGENLVGPNLADVGLRRTRDELLESIVKPNAKITEGFQTTALQLDTGQVVSGILRSENDKQAVLLDADDKEIVVDAASILDRFEGLSAMPEDLMKQMTPRDLRDLVEFLSQLRTPPGGHGAVKSPNP